VVLRKHQHVLAAGHGPYVDYRGGGFKPSGRRCVGGGDYRIEIRLPQDLDVPEGHLDAARDFAGRPGQVDDALGHWGYRFHDKKGVTQAIITAFPKIWPAISPNFFFGRSR
jgi:hypothetical protein